MRPFFFVIAVLGMTTFSTAASDAKFLWVNKNLAIANEQMVFQLRESLWPSATSVWMPTKEEALRGWRFLGTKRGRGQIIRVASAYVNMAPSLQNLSETRFQVYGLVIQGEKHLLYESAPNLSEVRLGYQDRWLEQSISQNVYDGGALIWFALYDIESDRVVAAHARPN